MLMRDATTGKLQRDADTGKLMRPAPTDNDCEFCDPGATPSLVTITLENLNECTCFPTPGTIFGDYSAHVVGLATILNGSSWVLPQYGLASINPCVWAKTFSGYFGQLRVHYTSEDCTGEYEDYPISFLGLWVEKCSATEIVIEVTVGASYPHSGYSPPYPLVYYAVYRYGTWNGYSWDCKAASITDCISLAGLANQNVCGSIPPYWHPACDGGSTDVEEGQTVSTFTDYRAPISDAAVQWTPGANNFENINDPPGAADDDSSYNYTNVGWYKDTFNPSAGQTPSGATITNVQLIGRFKRMDAGGSYLIRMLLYVNGGIYYGPSEQLPMGLPPAYVNKTATWATNPNTGAAWTVDDVNGIGLHPLQSFGYECMGFMKTVHCTQLYMKVNYTKTY